MISFYTHSTANLLHFLDMKNFKFFFKKKHTLYIFERAYYSSCLLRQLRYNLVITRFSNSESCKLRNRAMASKRKKPRAAKDFPLYYKYAG